MLLFAIYSIRTYLGLQVTLTPNPKNLLLALMGHAQGQINNIGLSVSGNTFYNRSCDEACGFCGVMLVLHLSFGAAHCVLVHILRLLVGDKSCRSCAQTRCELPECEPHAYPHVCVCVHVQARAEDYSETLAFVRLVNALWKASGPGIHDGGRPYAHFSHFVLNNVLVLIGRRQYK